jgi:hypothetical protein
VEVEGKSSSPASLGRPSRRNSGSCATTSYDRNLGPGADGTFEAPAAMSIAATQLLEDIDRDSVEDAMAVTKSHDDVLPHCEQRLAAELAAVSH